MFPLKPLEEVANIIRGITFKPNDVISPKDENAVVCFRTKNVQQSLDERDLIAIPPKFVKREDQKIKVGDILVSSANSWNLVGKCCYVPELDYKATAGGFISILRGKPEKIDSRYLYHWFSSPDIQTLLRSFGRKTTNISNLNINLTLQTPIPLPPLPEQKRIAEVLDKADALREKRRLALQKLDMLLQSVFLEMFGDLTINPKGWNKASLSDVCDINSPLVNPTDSKYLNLLHYGSDRIEKNTGRLMAAKTAQEDGITSVKFLFNEDAILYSKIRPNLNKVALAVKKGLCSADMYPVNVKNNKIRREFLWRILLSEDFLNYAAGFSNRANIPKINRQQFLGYQTILPPLEIQDNFVNLLKSLISIKQKFSLSFTLSENLFQVLQQKAFNGELFNGEFPIEKINEEKVWHQTSLF